VSSGFSIALVRSLLCLLLILAPVATACTPVQPVYKIGLLGSFEGLYRRNGYEALHAMRLALGEAAAQESEHPIAVIPLAMDSGRNGEEARRVVQKLLLDPALKAIIGPYDPVLIEAIRPLIEAQHVPWFLPFAIDPAAGMEKASPSTQWAEAMIRAVARVALEQGQRRLVLTGNSAGWPKATVLTKIDTTMPVVVLNSLDATEDASSLTADDALLWLGDVASGAAYLEELRLFYPDMPFWLGPWGGDPVFVERTTSQHAVYWISWLDERYDAWQQIAISQGISPSSATYLTYRATEAALVNI